MYRGKEYLYVDGYNVINAWPKLIKIMDDLSLEAARTELIHAMAEYQSIWGHQVIVIFDAHRVRGRVAVSEKIKGIEVVYTDTNETADSYIERQLDLHGKKDKIHVATSDGMIQQIILGRGGVRLSSMELLESYKRLRQINENFQKRRAKNPAMENLVTIDPKEQDRLEELKRLLMEDDR